MLKKQIYLLFLALFFLVPIKNAFSAAITDVELWFSAGGPWLKNPRDAMGNPSKLWTYSGVPISVMVKFIFDRGTLGVAGFELSTNADLYEADQTPNPDDLIIGLIAGPYFPSVPDGGNLIETDTIGPFTFTPTLVRGALVDTVTSIPPNAVIEYDNTIEIFSKNVIVNEPSSGRTWTSSSAAFPIMIILPGDTLPQDSYHIPTPEPNSLLLLLLGSVIMSLRRKFQ